MAMNTLDPARFLEGMFLAAAGIGVMFGLPMMASKYNGGFPLLALGIIAVVFYLYDQGYISF